MPATTSPQTPDDTIVTFARGARSATKLLVGGTALGLGVTFIATLASAGVVFGVIGALAGGKQVYEAGNELLPQKAKRAISLLFTGKEPAAEEPKKQLSLGGKLLKAATSAAVGFTGALAFFVGGFALGMGGTGAGLAFLALSGLALMTAATVQLGAQGFSAVRDLVQKNKAAKQTQNSLPAPDLSAAPKVGTLEAQPGFEKAASPEAKVAAPAPAPVNVPTPPRP